MIPRFYSVFWLRYAAGGYALAPEWAERDQVEAAPAHPAEVLTMGAWLRLSEGQRGDVVEAYARRRPRELRITV